MDLLSHLESRIAAGLRRFVSIFKKEGLPYAIIGAHALILQGIELDRSTRDLDIAVAIESRSHFLSSSIASNVSSTFG